MLSWPLPGAVYCIISPSFVLWLCSDSTSEALSRQVAPRMFCDICDMFDLHETEDCPQQAMTSDSPPPSHYGGSRDAVRPYCDTCESQLNCSLILLAGLWFLHDQIQCFCYCLLKVFCSCSCSFLRPVSCVFVLSLLILSAASFWSLSYTCSIRSLFCCCWPTTLEQSTCWHPVCPITHDILPETENSFISAVIPRHCYLAASP